MNFPVSGGLTGGNTGDSSLLAVVQDRTLMRVFRDAAVPRFLYRSEALPELWPVNLGANQTFTRSGLIRPRTRPLVGGAEAAQATYAVEQWEANAAQWAASIDTNMPTSYVSLASVFLRNVHQLGIHSAQSLNRVVRDKLINAYLGGNTVIDVTAGAAATQHVDSLNGLAFKLLNGRPQAVSAANPLEVSINGVTRQITSVTPDIPGDYIHGGDITFTGGALAVTDRQYVLAQNRSVIVRSGGGTRVDDLTSSDILTLNDVKTAVAQLRTANISPHEDELYHLHLDPIAEAQIFSDNEMQRLNQSLPDYLHYKRFAAGILLGVVFYRNSEAPLPSTVDQDPEYGFTFAGELTNPASVVVHRSILTGMGAIEEKFLDESKYISEAGVQGKIGEFAVTNQGLQVMTERIRLSLRSPIDRLQQQVAASWSFSGDWPVPTDALNLAGNAAYKRACVIESGAAA